MKTIKTLAPLCFLTSMLSAADLAEVKHQFLCIGNHKNVLIYIDQFEPNKSWSVNIPRGSRDIQILDEGKLLVSHGNGAGEYDLVTGKALTWKINRYKKIQSARRLPSGETVMLTSKGQIITVDADGNENSKVQIDQKRLDLRLIRTSPSGNWIIAGKNPRAVLEVSKLGKMIITAPLPGKSYTAIKLPNNNYLSSTGNECKVVELSPKGKIINFVGGKKEHPDLKLDFNSGWSKLPNGNIVMTNWLGHGKHNTAPHLVEFDATNKLIWSWVDHKVAKQVTNLLIIK